MFDILFPFNRLCRRERSEISSFTPTTKTNNILCVFVFLITHVSILLSLDLSISYYLATSFSMYPLNGSATRWLSEIWGTRPNICWVDDVVWPRSCRNFMMLSSSPLAWKSPMQVPTTIHVLTTHIYKRLSNNLDYSKFRQVSRRLNMDNQYLWISLNNFLTRQRRKYKTFVIFRQKRIDHKCKRENQMCLTMCTSKHTIGKHRRGGGSRARWMHIFRTFFSPLS